MTEFSLFYFLPSLLPLHPSDRNLQNITMISNLLSRQSRSVASYSLLRRNASGFKDLDKIVYTAKTTTSGGREGYGQTSDGILKTKLDKPTEMGGGATAPNPEQLFGIGYSACFLGAMKFVAGQKNVSIPDATKIDARVSFGPRPSVGFGLAVELDISVPGLAKKVVEELVKSAHEICPYSNATRGNIDVNLKVV